MSGFPSDIATYDLAITDGDVVRRISVKSLGALMSVVAGEAKRMKLGAFKVECLDGSTVAVVVRDRKPKTKKAVRP